MSEKSVKHISLLFLVMLSIITFGYYYIFWFILRNYDFKKMKIVSNFDLIIPVICLITLTVIYIIAISSATYEFFGEVELANYLDNLSEIMEWSIVLMLSIISFRYNNYINKIFKNEEVKVSVLEFILIILLGGLYLQYKINKNIKKNREKVIKSIDEKLN